MIEHTDLYTGKIYFHCFGIIFGKIYSRIIKKQNNVYMMILHWGKSSGSLT